MCIQFIDKNKLSWNKVYRVDNAKIIAFEVAINQTRDENTSSHNIYLLDSDCKFKKLLVSGTMEYQTVTVETSLDLSFDENVVSMVGALRKQSWYDVLLNETSILSLMPVEGKEGQNQLQCFGLKSKMKKALDFVGMADDRNLAMLRNGRKKIERNQTVLSASNIQWIAKNIIEV